jgi:hypothetical protein
VRRLSVCPIGLSNGLRSDVCVFDMQEGRWKPPCTIVKVHGPRGPPMRACRGTQADLTRTRMP